MDPGAVLLALLGSANLASRHAVFDQYDSTVGADTVAGPGRGAAVLRVKGTTKALVATTDGNQAVGAVDPWLGAALSVAEATRNVSITGARPLGVTNCLNYGDPTRPEAFWQLTEGVRGLADACRALGLPVTGGNVSLYNESPTGAIAPTAEIGVVGLLDDIDHAGRPGLRAAHDAVVLVGEVGPGAGRVRLRRTRRRRERGRPARPRPRAARRPSRRSSARRSRAAWSPRPRTSPAAAWPSRSPSARCGASSGRRSGSRSTIRRRWTCSGRARRDWS